METTYFNTLQSIKKHLESVKKLIDKDLLNLNTSSETKDITKLKFKFDFASKLSNIESYITNILNQINVIEKTLEKTA